jgi:hypothetical protein
MPMSEGAEPSAECGQLSSFRRGIFSRSVEVNCRHREGLQPADFEWQALPNPSILNLDTGQVAEWQTHSTQNRAPKRCVGSSPSLATLFEVGRGSGAELPTTRGVACSLSHLRARRRALVSLRAMVKT